MLTDYRLRASSLAIVGGGIAGLIGNPNGIGNAPTKVGFYKPKYYDRFGHKDVMFEEVHSFSSNATQMAKRKNPPTPPQSSRKVARTARSSRQRSARLPRQLAAYVAVPARRRTVARKSAKKSKILRRSRRRTYRSKGMRTSISAGFFSRGKSSQSILDKYSKKGVVISYEKGQQIFGLGNSVLMIHSNFAKQSLGKLVAAALTKLIAQHANLPFASWQNRLTGSALGTRITLYYRNIATGAIQSWASDFAINKTFTDVSDWIYNQMSNNITTDQYMLSALKFSDWVDPVPNNYSDKFTLNLDKAKIYLYSKSTLKIQNRSKASSVEADAVDNIPLFGKSYEGSGNYCLFRTDNSQEMQSFEQINTVNEYCSNGFMISNVGGFASLVEPPAKNMFTHVKREGSAHLDPGMIKTSALVYNRTVKLNTLIRDLDSVGAANLQTCKYGKFRMFIMEKLLQDVANVEANQINVAYEHDNKIAAYITAPKQVPTHYIINHANS